MTKEELKEKINEVSATIGLDLEDRELTDKEKEALLNFIYGNITKEEFIKVYGGEKIK